MALDRSLLLPALTNVATRLRIDSIRSTSEAGSGHPTSCCSAADLVAALFFAEMRFDPKDPAASRRAIASCCRRATPRRSCTRPGPRPAPSTAAELLKLRAHRLGSRRASDAAAAVRRRRHGLARPGHLRGDRLRAQRAAHQLGLPHLLLLGDGESAEGSVWEAARGRRRRPARQPLRHHRRQRARPEPADDVAARPGCSCAPLARVRLARDRRSTATTSTPSSTRTPRRARTKGGRR